MRNMNRYSASRILALSVFAAILLALAGQMHVEASGLGSSNPPINAASLVAAGGITTTTGDARYCKLAGCTMTGTLAGLNFAATATGAGFSDTTYSQTGSSALSMVSLAGILNTSGVPSVFKLVVTDTAHGAGTLIMSILGGAAASTNLLSLDTIGALTIGSTLTSSGSVQAGSSNSIGLLSRSRIFSSSDGTFQFRNSANSSDASLAAGGATFSTASVNMPALASSSAATTGTVCWTTSTGLLTVDTTTTCLLSARRFKQNIEPLGDMLAEVMALKPVSYELRPKYNPDHLGRLTGLIAEDVQKVDERLVSLEPAGPDKGKPHSVRYELMVGVLVKALQQEQAEIANDNLRIGTLEKKLKVLR